MEPQSATETTGNRKIYTVTEINRRIRTTLEETFGNVWLEGELSNLRQPSSGHFYFTIKDEQAQISAVLFRGNQRGMTFRPKDGMLVRVYGRISVYERGGNYQIIISRMEEGGKGTLQARFEELKAKLKKEGLFDAERKKPMPLLPQHIGVVTSRTGAAIRDILNVVTRRFPNLHLLLAPAKVQGEGAAAEIAEAIDLLNDRGGLDVMIVGRGGGSLEDLWCFNEEVVARAIARSSIPVISAVGHEIDFTISDFVADLRAPTPSAAAELVVGTKEAFEDRLGTIHTALLRSLRETALRARHRLDGAATSYVFREPANLVKQYLQRLDTAELRMGHSMRNQATRTRQRLEDCGLRLVHGLRLKHQQRTQDVRRLGAQLSALSPLRVLDRGYSVTTDQEGRAIRAAGDLKQGQKVTTRLARGRFDSEVMHVSTEE